MSILEQLLASPEFPKLVAQANTLVEQEAVKRAKFLEEMTPEMKAEFINGEVIMHSPARLDHLYVTVRLLNAILTHTDELNNGITLNEKRHNGLLSPASLPDLKIDLDAVFK